MGNDLVIAEMLLAAGAKADIADVFGDVPLHFAAKHPACLPILRLLLERAPHVVNKTGGAGVTPLIYATHAKFVEGIKLLLAHGADPTIKDMGGKTALDGVPNTKIKALLTGESDGATPRKTSQSNRTRPPRRRPLRGRTRRPPSFRQGSRRLVRAASRAPRGRPRRVRSPLRADSRRQLSRWAWQARSSPAASVRRLAATHAPRALAACVRRVGALAHREEPECTALTLPHAPPLSSSFARSMWK